MSRPIDQTVTAGSNADAKLVLEFDNNRLLPELYGAFGAHLTRIEEALDVSLVNRGNQVFVSGEAQACGRAELVLNTLYHHLQRGAEVTRGDVDGALRLSLDSLVATPPPTVGKNMSKSQTPSKAKRQSGGSSGDKANVKRLGDMTAIRTHRREVLPRSPMQAAYINALMNRELVVGTGPAGTGKTYTAVALAVKALKEKQVKRIIMTRPAVEAGENLGFLPGDLKEKLDPYMQPLYDGLRDMIPAEKLETLIENRTIQIAPLAFMRGRTLDNAFVILDEAQNTTHAQMKMFLTRMGKSAKFIITGDPGQIDLPRRVTSGLKEALLVLKDVDGVGMVYLDDKDVIRHKLVKKIISAYKAIENLDV